MAHVKLYRDAEDAPRIEVDGLDLTDEVFADGIRFVSTGPGEFDDVCLELKLAVSRLDIGEHEDLDAALLVGASAVNESAARGGAVAR